MKSINVSEAGEIEIRKLSKRDWEIIRNNCIKVDSITRQERTDVGSFIKYLVVLGIKKAPFFKTEYLENTRLDSYKLTEREEEYYNSLIEQNVFDRISNEIRDYNTINAPEIKEVSKEQSNI